MIRLILCLASTLVLAGCINLPKLESPSPLSGERIDFVLEASAANAHAHYLRGLAALDEDRAADAEKAFRRALELNGAFEEAWKGLAVSQLDRGQTAAARVSYEKVRALNASSADAAAGLATVDLLEGSHDSARIHAQRALALSPEGSEAEAAAYRLLGDLDYIAGDYPCAVMMWERVPNLDAGTSRALDDLRGYVRRYGGGVPCGFEHPSFKE